MAKEWPFPNVPAGPARAILACLRAAWPEPIVLTPSRAGLEGETRDFLRALVALQDAGWLMFETLLAGAGQEPVGLHVVLTAKGKSELANAPGES